MYDIVCKIGCLRRGILLDEEGGLVLEDGDCLLPEDWYTPHLEEEVLLQLGEEEVPLQEEYRLSLRKRRST